MYSNRLPYAKLKCFILYVLVQVILDGLLTSGGMNKPALFSLGENCS